MDAETKKKIIEEYATTAGDTGSPDVQIALLTKRIAHLTEHLKTKVLPDLEAANYVVFANNVIYFNPSLR